MEKCDIEHLSCFKTCKYKSGFICSCSDSEINSLCKLIELFLKGKLNIKNREKVIKKLSPIKKVLRTIVRKDLCIQTKRKILIQIALQEILFPIITKVLIPALK